jgi:hypothetical protein
MISTPRRLAAIASAIGALAVATPVTGAYAAGSTSSGSAGAVPTFNLPLKLPANLLPRLPWTTSLTFVPPAVGPIVVNIGAIIIGGKVISPGLHVATPGVTLPPIPFVVGG